MCKQCRHFDALDEYLEEGERALTACVHCHALRSLTYEALRTANHRCVCQGETDLTGFRFDDGRIAIAKEQGDRWTYYDPETGNVGTREELEILASLDFHEEES